MIAFSSSTFDAKNPNQIKDGIGVYSENLYLQLIKRNIDVALVRYPSTWIRDTSKELKSHEFNHRFSYPIDYCLSYANHSRSFDEKYLIDLGVNLYHSTDYRIPKLKRVPVVATLHDAVLIAKPEWGSGNKYIRKIKNFIMKDVAQKADHIITISNFCTQEISQYWGIEHSKISAIHIGINDDWHYKSTESKIQNTLNKYNLDPNFILFVGTIQPRKNLRRIILAYLCLASDLRKKHKLVIAGKFGWKCQEEKNIIKDLIHEGIITYIPNAINEEIKCLYECANLFVFPTLHEGFGIPVLEAMACSTPTLTSYNTAAAEIGGNCVSVCDPNSIKSISNEMENILTDNEYSKELRSKGKQRARQFSWEKASQSTLDVYKKFI